MKKDLLLFFTGLFAATAGFCQINIPANSLTKENFNAIGSSATATLPASWKMSSAGTGASSGYATGTNVTATTQAASSGTPTTGGRYNWATTPGTDRAIGFMSDAGYADGNAIFADYKNTTGATITSVNLSFNIERYRINTGTAFVSLFSSTDGSTWTARSAGDISAAVFTPGASSYTFTSPQTVYKNITVSGISIANNADIYFRWVFTTGGTNSQGLALDDVVLYAPPATPVVTGSMRDNLQVDNNADNQAGQGDQLRYTTVVRNTGTSDATGVTFTNLTPAHTTLNPGSVKTSALARDDSYSTAQNTLLNGSTVLANDFGLPAPTVISFGPVSDASTVANGTNTAKSDNGGTVLMNTDGTFTYTPAAGFAGFDRFAYVATTGTAPDNAGIVTITVGSSTISTGAAESYNVTGNVSITTPNSGVGNLLNNDTGNGIAIGSVNGSSSNVGNPITTANGGTLTVNANGSFTYNPAPGYEGPDNFTYTVDNGFSNPSAPVTVTLTVAGMVWFIDNNYAGTLTDGRLGSPFKTIAAFQGINDGTGNHPAVNDNIFIYESATDYNGNISLLNGQKLIGQDATASLSSISGITLPLYSAPFPATNSANGTIVRLITTAAATNAITLLAGASNTVRGLTIGNTTGAKLFSAGFGTLTVGDNALPDVTLNGSGQAMNLSAGIFAATSGFVSVTSTSSGTQGINLSGITGTVDFSSTNISGAGTQGILVGTSPATINFGNTVVSAGTDGISFQNNSGANIKTFGTLSITTTGAFSSFLHANGGGAVTAGATTISNGTGNGIDISNNITAVTFGATTVTKSGAGNAINIANTGAAAGNITFTSVTLGTAGTRLTGPAINIVNTGGTNTSVYDFGAVSIFTNAATGVIATNVDGTINMSSGTVDVTGAGALNISGPAGFTTLGMTLTTVNSNGGTNNINLTNCAGNATLNGGTLTGTAAGATFNVSGGTLNLTYNGAIAQAAAAAMVSVSGGHTTGTVSFNTGILNATSGTGLQFNNADGTYNFNGTTTLNGGSAAVNIINGSGGTFNFNSTTSITSPADTAFNILGGTATVNYNGNITQSNVSSFPAVAVSQAHAAGTVTFQTGAISATTGTGLQFDNADGTYSFTGVVTLNGGDAGIDVLNGSAGTISVSNSSSNINNPTNELIKVNASSANVTYSGTFTKTNNTANGILVNAETGGTITINGTSTKTITNTAGNAVNLTSNTGATINFSGNNLLLTTSSGTGFNATGGGTISVAGTGNTISSTTGTALNVANTTIGAGNLNFKSIAANGALSGIIINTTGATGSLVISGNGNTSLGGDFSGGIIQNTTSHGIQLISTKAPSFTNLDIQNAFGSGIKTDQVNGFIFNNGTINNTGTGGTVDEANIGFNTHPTDGTANVTGVVTITKNVLTNSKYHGVDIQQYGGAISSLTISNNTFTSSALAANSLGTAIRITVRGTAGAAASISSATITNNTITNFPSGAGIIAQGGNGTSSGSPGVIFGTAGTPFTITGNLIAGPAGTNMAAQAINYAVDGVGTGQVDISNNGTVGQPLANTNGVTLAISAFGNATVNATMLNNYINSNTIINGQPGIAVGVDQHFAISDVPILNIQVSNNVIQNTQGNGILAKATSSQGKLNVNISNNNVAAPLGGVRPGIRVDCGNNTAGENCSVCADIRTNTSAGSGGTQGIGLRKQGTSTAVDIFGIEGMAATSTPGIESYVSGLNPAGNGVLLISATSGFSNCNTAP